MSISRTIRRLGEWTTGVMALVALALAMKPSSVMATQTAMAEQRLEAADSTALEGVASADVDQEEDPPGPE